MRFNLRALFLTILNYMPGLVVLVFSMIALHSSVLMIAEYESLWAELSAKGMAAENQNIIEKRINWLYWSVIAVGFAAFVLILLNTDKLLKLRRASEEIQKNLDEREELQNQFFQAQKMEAIGRLAGGIAHDFNNILAAMNGYAEFLIEDLKEGSTEQSFAKNIMKAGVQARSLVDQLLAFSRRKESDITHMDLLNPIQETLSMLHASLPKSIEVKTDIEFEVAPILGNPTQISQLLMNLCLNAKDAMEDDRGLLQISLSKVDALDPKYISITSNEFVKNGDSPLIRIEDIVTGHSRLMLSNIEPGSNYFSLSVKDSGSGMSRSIMEHIFEPFFTTKPVDKGTGLGLATVHGVVVSHKAALIIDSTIDEGTCFDLLFPLSEGVTEVKTLDKSAAEDVGAGKILVVEDQEHVRDMVTTMLHRVGFEVQVAVTGLDALDIIRENPEKFDLVLTDYNMPKMTGLELVQEAYHDFPDLPFIVFSGYSKKELAQIMEENASVKAVLRKPVSKDKLIQEINNALAAGKTKRRALAS